MTLFDRILSLTTLLSIFILGPPLGRVLWLWWDQKRTRSLAAQQVALAISTMTVIVMLAIVYGGLWKIHPRMVAWYSWIDTSLPISGDVELNNQPVDVKISNEPVDVTISR